MNFGKCHQYLDPKNSTSILQCKCFMFRATENEEYLCACCGHDRHFHEPSIPTSIQPSIAAQELNELNVENFEFNIDELITRVRVVRNDFKVINLFNVGPEPKIPRGIKKLEKDGKMKLIHFSEGSNNGIKNVIEVAFPCLKDQNWVFFRCNSTSDLRVADRPASGWNIEELKKISGCRKKLYIGVVSPQIQSSNFHPTENFQPITNFQQTEIFQTNYQSATNLESNFQLDHAYRIMNHNITHRT